MSLLPPKPEQSDDPVIDLPAERYTHRREYRPGNLYCFSPDGTIMLYQGLPTAEELREMRESLR